MFSIINLENKLSEKYFFIILMVGVNGVGKIIFIGKIVNFLKLNGKKVLIVVVDIFRVVVVE